MGLASLYVAPSTPQELATWQFSNVAHHRDINNTTFRLLGVTLPEYVLAPFDPEDQNSLNAFLEHHQAMHTQMDTALGIAGFNLSEVDWQDANALASWIAAHAQEHQQAAQILKLT